MIPAAHVRAWRLLAPWSTNQQVEQDLIISRALVEAYSDPLVADQLAFRGGTALHKLNFKPPMRYSEDVDLVQVHPGPIGETVKALRGRLDSWLGQPSWKQNEGRFTLVYRFNASGTPVTPIRLKVEINTREHFAVLGYKAYEFHVKSGWFEGKASLLGFDVNELLGTKLRALYQRKKSRDLFDLAMAIRHIADVDPHQVVRCFQEYMAYGGHRVTRAQFEENLLTKVQMPEFATEVGPLLPEDAAVESMRFDIKDAHQAVHETFITHLPGKAWKGLEGK